MSGQALPFVGRIGELEVADRSAWPAAVKAAKVGSRELRAAGYQSSHSSGIKVPKTWKPAPLTADEQEWLGATVRRSDGLEAQVWALAPTSRGAACNLWLVTDGVAYLADVASVTKLTGRLDLLDLGE